MQQTSINFEGYALNPSASSQEVTLKERIQSAKSSVNNWLDTKSVFYSRIAEFDVTRRVAIRVNLVTVAMIVAVVAIETEPVAALAAALSTAWVMYRGMMKKGGEQ